MVNILCSRDKFSIEAYGLRPLCIDYNVRNGLDLDQHCSPCLNRLIMLVYIMTYITQICVIQ